MKLSFSTDTVIYSKKKASKFGYTITPILSYLFLLIINLGNSYTNIWNKRQSSWLLSILVKSATNGPKGKFLTYNI